MSPFVKAFFLLNVFLGTFLTFIATHWLLAWVGLELNTLAMIPVMIEDRSPRHTEATVKYFLVQALGAMVLISGAAMNAYIYGWHISSVNYPPATVLITLGIALKMGLAPFHLWYPDVMQGIPLGTCLILSTWQKLAPFALIIQASDSLNPHLLAALGLLSTLVGAWGGINQTQVRKIMAYSSIAHLGWMFIIIQHSPRLAALTMLSYFVMTTALFVVFKQVLKTSLSSLALKWTKNPILVFFATLILASLAGLPPLTGFMPKVMILTELAEQHFPLLAIATALSALISLFFYLRLGYILSLIIWPNVSSSPSLWRGKLKSQFTLPAITATALMFLPLMPTILAYLELL
uniref:NADH-ubiquinone oxidoreductase chain 2 n=1 Tax=Prionobrama filigera TaxID=1180191 RepID=A0A7S7A9X0_9TELE|nr:NADH dehydrogenase subunit 2 [Prionobrama filigera]